MKERVSNIDYRNRWTFWTETHGRDARGFCVREENACQVCCSEYIEPKSLNVKIKYYPQSHVSKVRLTLRPNNGSTVSDTEIY